MKKIKQHFKNILIIGDPHISSRQISKRKDDIHTSQTVLNKMRQAAQISREQEAYTCILGDLFDRDKEKDISLLNQVIDVFKEFYHPPLTIIGNHEKTEDVLQNYNMISVLLGVGLLDAIEDNQVSVQIPIDHEQETYWVEIGGTNYGSNIPNKVAPRSKKTHYHLWLTHHDLIFQKEYPNAIELKWIKGIDLAINGHIHMYQGQVKVGDTFWFCPGNILRQSIDTKDHEPSVWLWNPQQQQEEIKLKAIPLHYKKDIFRIEEDIPAYESTNFTLPTHNQLNLQEIVEKVSGSVDNNLTEDKALLTKIIEEMAEQQNLPPDIKNEILIRLEQTELEE